MHRGKNGTGYDKLGGIVISCNFAGMVIEIWEEKNVWKVNECSAGWQEKISLRRRIGSSWIASWNLET
jgi:hypothetical protein